MVLETITNISPGNKTRLRTREGQRDKETKGQRNKETKAEKLKPCEASLTNVRPLGTMHVKPGLPEGSNPSKGWTERYLSWRCMELPPLSSNIYVPCRKVATCSLVWRRMLKRQRACSCSTRQLDPGPQSHAKACR